MPFSVTNIASAEAFYLTEIDLRQTYPLRTAAPARASEHLTHGGGVGNDSDPALAHRAPAPATDNCLALVRHIRALDREMGRLAHHGAGSTSAAAAVGS